MLKDRTHKGSWKTAANSQRMKKKSYGNIHTINDRGIHEIYETFTNGGAAGGGGQNGQSGPSNGGGGYGGGTGSSGSSAPNSPWSSPLMGRRSFMTTLNPNVGQVQAERSSSVCGSGPASSKLLSIHQ